MDEECQKYKVAYCSDRYTENRDKQCCTESLKIEQNNYQTNKLVSRVKQPAYDGNHSADLINQQ